MMKGLKCSFIHSIIQLHINRQLIHSPKPLFISLKSSIETIRITQYIILQIPIKQLQILQHQMINNNKQSNQSNQNQSQKSISSTSNNSQPRVIPLRSPQLINASRLSSNVTNNNHNFGQDNYNTNVNSNYYSSPFNINSQYNSLAFQQPVQQQSNFTFTYSPSQQFNVKQPTTTSSNSFFSYISSIFSFGSNGKKGIYNDDETIKKKAKIQTKGSQQQSKIQFKLISQYPQVQLNNNLSLPCLCSIKGSGGVRANVDIICVIDISGSMRGQKIALVRDTMRYVVEMLSPQDRLSIVVYNSDGTRLCPLKFVNSTNKGTFQAIISKLQADGGNIMLNGLEVAVNILRERKTSNEVSSIFLLSDGQEPHETDALFKAMLQKKQNEEIGSFSLHSFGFGADHDEDLMTKICSMKDGNFYFINQLSSLDQAFCNALGGIITQTASDIQIIIEPILGPLQGATIQKVYGDKWKKTSQNSYKIEINQIMSEVSKDFVFELFIPKTKFQHLEGVRSLWILKASFTALGNNGHKLQGQSILKLQIVDDNAVLNRQSNSQVIEGYMRLKAVQIMGESIKLAQQGQFDLARKQIEDIIETIKYHPNIRKQKIKGLLEDLSSAKQKCTKQVFENIGRKELVNLCYSNTNQSSFQYSNNCQQQMLFDLKSKKH